MKTANILLRHPLDENETIFRAKNYDMSMCFILKYKDILKRENPNQTFIEYLLAISGSSVQNSLQRISFLAKAVNIANSESISGLFYDCPINYDINAPSIEKYKQLTMLEEVQKSLPNSKILANVVSPELLYSGPHLWEPWRELLVNVSGGYFVENWLLSTTTQSMIDYVNNFITKPMVIAFRRDGSLSSADAKNLANNYAMMLDRPNRWFAYREGLTWRQPIRIETWQYNEMFQRG